MSYMKQNEKGCDVCNGKEWKGVEIKESDKGRIQKKPGEERE